MINKVLFTATMLLLGLSGQVLAQSDSTQLENHPKKRLPMAYVAGVFENSPVSPMRTTSFGMQAAVLIKKHWQLGFYGTKHTADNYQEQLIFPNFFQMNYKHGGLMLGYRTNLQKEYEFNLESKIGWGESKWKEVDAGNSFLADKFQALQWQFGMDYMITGFLAGNVYFGYRKITGLEITGLENQDFNGWYYGLMIKLGRFK